MVTVSGVLAPDRLEWEWKKQVRKAQAPYLQIQIQGIQV